MSAPHNKPVSELAQLTGVAEATLYLWRKQAREQGRAVPGDGQNPEQWSSADKFAVVLEAAPLNEAELAVYCRRKGLLVEQLGRWRTEVHTALSAGQSRVGATERASDKKRIRELERDLRRKEKNQWATFLLIFQQFVAVTHAVSGSDAPPRTTTTGMQLCVAARSETTHLTLRMCQIGIVRLRAASSFDLTTDRTGATAKAFSNRTNGAAVISHAHDNCALLGGNLFVYS